MLLKTRRSRALLLKYSGYTPDRKCLKSPSDLTLAEFRELKSLLHKEGASPLANLLERLWQETRKRTSPQVYREFLCELSKSTPVCGMLQAAGNQDALHIVNAIATGSFDITNSANHKQLSILQEHIPILCSFLVKCPRDEDNHLPSDVCRILHLLTELMVAPFTIPTSRIYPPPQPDSPLSFFPNLPQLHGDALYAADVATRPALIVIHAGKMPMDIPHYPLECSLSSACMAFATGLRFSSHTNLQNTHSHSQSSRPIFRQLQR